MILRLRTRKGMLPIHAHWLDIPASIRRWEAAGAKKAAKGAPHMLDLQGTPVPVAAQS